MTRRGSGVENHFRWLCLTFLLLSTVQIIKKGVDATEDTVPPDDEEFCDYNDTENAQGEDATVEVSFCQEVMEHDKPKLYNQDDFNILAALGTSVLNKTYPSRVNTTRAFVAFDELPYPVPTGATSYFMVLFTVIFTWYFTKFLHWLLKDTAKHLDLFPVTDTFPNVNIYTLQQSKRELALNRDARNTWSWLATFYLLKPSDPNINPDEVFRTSGWDDFQVPHDVWYIIKAVLRINALSTAERLTKAKAALESASDPGGRADIKSTTRGNERASAEKINPDGSARLLMLRNLLEKTDDKDGSNLNIANEKTKNGSDEEQRKREGTKRKSSSNDSLA